MIIWGLLVYIFGLIEKSFGFGISGIFRQFDQTFNAVAKAEANNRSKVPVIRNI